MGSRGLLERVCARQRGGGGRAAAPARAYGTTRIVIVRVLDAPRRSVAVTVTV